MINDIKSRQARVALVVIPLAFVISYWSTILCLVTQWMLDDTYSHGTMILPIVLYLVWHKRAVLKATNVFPDWRALSVVFLGVGVGVVGELGAELFTTRLSMLIVAVGLTWFICGSQVVRVLRFPLAFLFLMLPFPGFIYSILTLRLQLISTVGAVRLLNVMGISAHGEGNVIDLGITQLQVVEACNGLRYLLPLLTFGILYAYLAQTVTWKRIVHVMAALPIAILANVLRLAGAGISVIYWGSFSAEGFFHGMSAIVVIVFCAPLIFLLNLLLSKLPSSSESKNDKKDRMLIHRKPIALKHITWSSVLASLVVLLVSGPVIASLGHVQPLRGQRPLSSFPLEFTGWTGSRLEMDPAIWEQVGGQDYVIIDYFKPGKHYIEFYVAYYEYQQKGGDFIHSPRLCLTGAGCFIEKDRVRQIPKHTGEKDKDQVLNINELLIKKNEARGLVYFWYQGRGRNITNEFAAKFYMVWDGLLRRRTDGALVRLVMPIQSGECVEDVRRILDQFAVAATKALADFLPS